MRHKTHTSVTLTRGAKASTVMAPAHISAIDTTDVLDHMAFVSELNDANLFMIKEGMAHIALFDAPPHGIARNIMRDICRDAFIPVMKQTLRHAESYEAVVFATDTMGELTPVKEINSRRIIDRFSHHILENIIRHFHKRIPQYSKNQINYGKDNQKKCNRQVAGWRTLERT